MNETITIKEGGLTRRLAPIDKLKVNTTDNKDSTWVSAGKANTGVLHASENGIYIASEDGYEAYSEVIVRVTKDSFEGDTSFDDWDYETPDMDLDNWDPETVEEFKNDPEGFDDVFNNEDEWKDIDKPIDIKMNNPKIKDTKISGIDPITGNEMEVGLDEDGYLTESTLPSSIKIITPPNKLQYVSGQPIYIRGIVVKAYTQDGNLWTDENHPDGIIPESELSFSPTTAYNSDEGGEWSDGDGVNAIKLSCDNVYDQYDGSGIVRSSAIGTLSPNDPNYGHVTDKTVYTGTQMPSTYLLTFYEGNVYAKLLNINSQQFRFIYKADYRDSFYYYGNFSPYDVINNQQFKSVGITYIDENTHNIPVSTKDPSSAGDMHSVGQTVTVSYIRSDGEELTDTYTIEVLPDPDGAHPQVDPSTVEWNHRKYKANEDLGAVEVRHGSVYMEGGAIYDVGAAVRLGMLEPVDNEIVP